ncbi:unnamed protein product [Coccothraustes coccothraustes]
MQALREAEHANRKVSEAKCRSQAAFGRSRALESTATGIMLSARRSRFFASDSRIEWPLLRREERSRKYLAFSAQPSNTSRTALREAEHANLELPESKRQSRAAFSRSRALQTFATGTMLSARRSRFFASGCRTARPLLRREERSRT